MSARARILQPMRAVLCRVWEHGCRRLGRLVVRLESLRRADPGAFLRDCRGVIHVGANKGQERDAYACLDLSVLWIEPIPAVFSQLAAATRGYPKQVCVQALLSDTVGRTYEFHVASNGGASSSILEFRDHEKLWPDIVTVSTLKLSSTTLDALAADPELDFESYDALLLDTQGSELLVLRGAVNTLSSFRFVQVEAANFAAYAGGAVLEEIDDFLRAAGFRERARVRFAMRPGVGSYYDVVYERCD